MSSTIEWTQGKYMGSKLMTLTAWDVMMVALVLLVLGR